LRSHGEWSFSDYSGVSLKTGAHRPAVYRGP
jgi:hypothetical protein